MRIGIDARMYGSAQTGIGTYVKQLTDALFRMDHTNAYIVFARSQLPSTIYQLPNVHVVHVSPRWYSWREQITLPYTFWRKKLDILFVPHFNAPVWYPGKLVVTIHDVTPIDFPARGLRPAWLRRGLFLFVAGTNVVRANAVIAVSEFTKQQLVSHFRIKQDRISVIPEAPRFSKVSSLDSSLLSSIYHLQTPYLLFIGVLRPHKNVLGLLEAFALLRKQFRDLMLVLAGPEDPRYPEVRERAQKSDIRDKIRFLGFVPDEHLPHLLAGALCVVVPSFVEGFGLVGLEALVQGVPVAASRAGALPEVLGDAAVYFDPHDPGDMADVISKILSDAAIRAKLFSVAPRVLSRYSWDLTAQKTLNILLSSRS